MTPLWEEAAANRERLLAWAQSLTKDAGEAEEAVQDTLVVAWRKAVTVKHAGARWSWLYAVLHNRIRTGARGRKRKHLVLDMGAFPAEGPVVADSDPPSPDLVLLMDGMVSLRPSYQEILEQVCGEEVPLSEFAERRGITRNNAKVRLFRARRALRLSLGFPTTRPEPQACRGPKP